MLSRILLTPSILLRSPWRRMTTVTDSALSAAMQRLQEGNHALAAQQPEVAQDKYLASLELAPTSEAYYNLGNVCLQLGQPQDAIQHYEASLHLAEHPDTLINLANVEFMTRRDGPKAIALYERALAWYEANPASSTHTVGEVWFNLGCVCDAVASGTTDSAAALAMWSTAEAAFAAAEKYQVERADMFRRNVAAKKLQAHAKQATAPVGEDGN